MAGALDYALTLNNSGFTGPMRGATGLLGSFTAKAGKAALVLGPIAIGLGAITTAAAGASVGLKAFNAAADFEQTSTSFRVLIGDVEKAQKTLQDLREFSNVTPFQFIDVADAAKKLLAFGSDTNQLTAEIGALGDIASGLNIPLTEMAELYGKARTQGTLYSEDINQLAGRGVPIFEQLAQITGKTTGEVRKLASEGQITFPYLQQAFKNLTTEGGQFYGMMQEQSGTTKGLISTLQSAWQDLLITIGSPINDFIKPILTNGINQMQDLGARVSAFFKLLSQAKEEGDFYSVLGAGLELAAINFINTFSGGIRGAVAYLGAALPVAFSGIKDALFSENNVRIYENIFAAGAALLKAGLLEGVAALADALNLPSKNLKDAAEFAKKVEAGVAINNALGKNAEFGGPKPFDAGDIIGKSLQNIADAHEAGSEAFKNAASKKLIDPQAARDKFAEKSNGLDSKLVDTVLNGPVQQIKEKTDLIVDTFETASEKIKKSVPTPKPTRTQGQQQTFQAPGQEHPERRRGVLNAAESLAARNARQSEADKQKFRDFAGTSSLDRAAVRDFARANNISLNDAVNQLQGGSRAASPAHRGGANAAARAQEEAARRLASEETLRKIESHLGNFSVA